MATGQNASDDFNRFGSNPMFNARTSQPQNPLDRAQSAMTSAKSIEQLEAELRKLEQDRANWNTLVQTYSTFVSSSATTKIFNGPPVGGLHADSQGLSEYKTALNSEFNNNKKAQCETTMENQKTRLEQLIAETEQAIEQKKAEQAAAAGG